MKPGSVIVDMASSERGGNCELTQSQGNVSRATWGHAHWYTLIMPSRMAKVSSDLYMEATWFTCCLI